MCGLTGVLTFSGRPLRTERLKGMVDVIAHRGPDDAGYLVWQTGAFDSHGHSYGQDFTDCRYRGVSPLLPEIDTAAGRQKLDDEKWNLFLGHRRLSIIDLSPRGHQPMSDKTRNIWLAYNGEIYNFRELRAELQAREHRFVSKTDSEVIIHAYEEWGIECVGRLNGMFAFALYDNTKKALFLARDRYGIKPLYYRMGGDALVFGSEIKSILAYDGKPPAVDLLALNEYFSFQNVLSDRTLFAGIRMLPPGRWLRIDAQSGNAEHRQYWDFDFANEARANEKEIEEKLYGLIKTAVERQCVSDVPIGSYLSGGMDSGSITSLAAGHLGRICTFTGGFDLSEATDHEMRFDEREQAERMASIFQTEHYECVMHAGDMAACMDKLIWHLEDLRVGQCYPNYYMSRLASKFVKVVLSGAGGDELFGGYPWRYAAAVGADHDGYIQNYYKYWKRLVPNAEKPLLFQPGVCEEMRKLDDCGGVPFKDHTLSVFRRVFGHDVNAGSVAEQVNWSLYFECKTFLHGLLVVEDKLSMAHSLETRVPLLDNDLVDFACTVPVRYKISGLEDIHMIDENMPRKQDYYRDRFHSGKNILRRAMERIMPREITESRKQGFSAPDETWFRGRAGEYVRDVLLSRDAKSHRYISPDFIKKTLDEHCGKKTNKRLLVWSLLCFERWLDRLDRCTDNPVTHGPA